MMQNSLRRIDGYYFANTSALRAKIREIMTENPKEFPNRTLDEVIDNLDRQGWLQRVDEAYEVRVPKP